eukprot:2948533-Amphidinium_carterae.1
MWQSHQMYKKQHHHNKADRITPLVVRLKPEHGVLPVHMAYHRLGVSFSSMMRSHHIRTHLLPKPRERLDSGPRIRGWLHPTDRNYPCQYIACVCHAFVRQGWRASRPNDWRRKEQRSKRTIPLDSMPSLELSKHPPPAQQRLRL